MLTKELNLKYANGLPEYGKEINPNITAEEVDDSILPMLSSSVRHFIMINNGQWGWSMMINDGQWCLEYSSWKAWTFSSIIHFFFIIIYMSNSLCGNNNKSSRLSSFILQLGHSNYLAHRSSQSSRSSLSGQSNGHSAIFCRGDWDYGEWLLWRNFYGCWNIWWIPWWFNSLSKCT